MDTVPPGGRMKRITELLQTCEAMPSQWEGSTEDGECVYIRYRGGQGRIGFGQDLHEAVLAKGYFTWEGDDYLDGYITLKEIQQMLAEQNVDITFGPAIQFEE